MVQLHLIRVEIPRQTIGKLLVYHGDVERLCCYTLELPWRENRRFESCIPYGEYPVVPRISQAFGEHLHIKHVSDRSHILIHAGNFLSDTDGCILAGRELKNLDGDILLDVTYSRQTIKRLVAAVDDQAQLTISKGGPDSIDTLPPSIAHR